MWVYTAPPSIPRVNPVNITAESVADPTKSGTAEVTIKPKIDKVTVTIQPDKADVLEDGEQEFTVTVEGTTDKCARIMSLSPSLGDIEPSGKKEGQWTYKAPEKIEKPTIVDHHCKE